MTYHHEERDDGERQSDWLFHWPELQNEGEEWDEMREEWKTLKRKDFEEKNDGRWWEEEWK